MPVRKTIKVIPDPTQMDILKRSVVADSLTTIRFGWMKEQIAEKWEGPGEVECRDLGPFRCILTFETIEARDAALVSLGLNSLFFELRPQWGFTMVRSRRVWIEVVGVPIHLWSKDTFMEIGKIWGKPEWITLEDGERKFDAFVKEFGREMYSAQAHPGDYYEESLCRSGNPDVNGGQDSECNSRAVPEMAAAPENANEGAGTGMRKDNGMVNVAWDPVVEELITRRDAHVGAVWGSDTADALVEEMSNVSLGGCEGAIN
ncbi:hypothetical protein PIB30_012175 [Stylosanthes scabra]|uniref:DUF4283 domain-containing protein n=1 Tax=Stylosanthes scabra TaxID=79078 RepID=A0ABU6T7T4_9FABA|nr:hypothetical protein [Stylosanthes scabra]